MSLKNLSSTYISLVKHNQISAVIMVFQVLRSLNGWNNSLRWNLKIIQSLPQNRFKNFKKKCPIRRGEFYLKKSKCHIHAKLQVRIQAIYRLRFEHTTVTLCCVLHVNRSTYYNFINKKPSKREIDNQCFRTLLLEIYMKSKKRIGTGAFKIILLRDYGTNISEGRIYRLLETCLNKNSILKRLIKSGPLTSLIFLLDISGTFTSVLFLTSTLESVLLGSSVIK